MSKDLFQDTVEKSAQNLAGNLTNKYISSEDIFDYENWAEINFQTHSGNLKNTSNFFTILDELCNVVEMSFSLEATYDLVINHKTLSENGFIIRVYKDNQITFVFQKLYEICKRLKKICFLNEEDYRNRCYEATIENISYSIKSLEIEIPSSLEDAAINIFDWLLENRPDSVEYKHYKGADPNEEEVMDVLKTLGLNNSYKKITNTQAKQNRVYFYYQLENNAESVIFEKIIESSTKTGISRIAIDFVREAIVTIPANIQRKFDDRDYIYINGSFLTEICKRLDLRGVVEFTVTNQFIYYQKSSKLAILSRYFLV